MTFNFSQVHNNSLWTCQICGTKWKLLIWRWLSPFLMTSSNFKQQQQLKYLPNTWWGKKSILWGWKFGELIARKTANLVDEIAMKKKICPKCLCGIVIEKQNMNENHHIEQAAFSKRGDFIHVVYGWRAMTHVWFVPPLEHVYPTPANIPFH